VKREIHTILAALNKADVRYVVAGGLAVIAHGYLRATMDVDLVVDLERDNLLKALAALDRIGYKPRLPVTAEQFADEKIRDSWINEKEMLVFPLWKPAEARGLVVDVFVKCPFDFGEEYGRAEWLAIDGDLTVPFVGLDCLLRMKKEAARPKDLVDIEYLEKARDGKPTNER